MGHNCGRSGGKPAEIGFAAAKLFASLVVKSVPLNGAFFAIDGLDQVKGPEILEPAFAGIDALRSVAEQMPDKLVLATIGSRIIFGA